MLKRNRKKKSKWDWLEENTNVHYEGGNLNELSEFPYWLLLVLSIIVSSIIAII